jgi:hypothetical protein
VLDRVAPQTAGTMSIGTIDCTVEKKLCDQYKVRGYPTLKFAIDGEIYNYDGGRTEHDLIELSNKMLRPIIESVNSIDIMKQYLSEKTETGIAFLFYDPAIAFTPELGLENDIATTSLGQLFIQVSRKFRASGSFFILQRSESITPEVIASSMQLKDGSGPFLCRMEIGVPPRCYDAVKSTTPMKKYINWIEGQNVPTVSQLGAHNFHKLGRSGRQLAIAIIDEQNQEQVDFTKTEFTKFAMFGPPNIRDRYYYAYFDGNTWKNFLAQFDVYPNDIPQVLVLDVPIQSYYQNATYKLNLHDFLLAIESGKIKSKFAGHDGLDGKLMLLYRIILLYRPWSVMLMAVLLVSIVVGIWLCVRPEKESLSVKMAKKDAILVDPPPTTTIDLKNGTTTVPVDALKDDDTKKDE